MRCYIGFERTLKQTKINKFLLIILLLVAYAASGQATFSTANTAQDLADQITGPGITITNPVISSGVATQTGTFSNGVVGAGLQLDSGIILTTGTVAESFSTNSAGGILGLELQERRILL